MNLFKLSIVTIFWFSLMACTTKSLKESPASQKVVLNPDKAAIFPGCEKYTENRALLHCLSKQVGRHVRRHFNTDLGKELGIVGRQKIRVKFKVDADGNVVDIKAKANLSKLEQEAIRITKLLPKMGPAVKNGANVMTQYALPISFLVE